MKGVLAVGGGDGLMAVVMMMVIIMDSEMSNNRNFIKRCWCSNLTPKMRKKNNNSVMKIFSW